MRRKRFGLRTITGLLLAGLVAAGLQSGTATAAADAVRGPDLALGKSVTADGAHAGHPAGNITDGRQLSYWEGPAGAFPQSVRVDLGGTVEADQVVLELPSGWEARTQTLAVEGSTDGNSSTSLSGSAAHRFDPADGNTVTLDFTAREVRHIRVRLTANTGWNAAQLSEIEVYGSDDDGDPQEPPVDGTDLAFGKPVEASSTIHSFVAANANDGRTETDWESGGHPATLTTELGADADLSGVVVALDPDPVWAARTQSIEVLGRAQTSDTFTSVRARADYTFDPGSNRNTVTIPFTGRYADVRLRFTHNSSGYVAQVAELKVMGTAAPNPDLVVSRPRHPPRRTPSPSARPCATPGRPPPPPPSMSAWKAPSRAAPPSARSPPASPRPSPPTSARVPGAVTRCPPRWTPPAPSPNWTTPTTAAPRPTG